MVPPSCLGDSPRPLFVTLLMLGYLLSFMRVSNKNQVRLLFHSFVHSVDTPCRSPSSAEFWREYCGCTQLFCSNRRSGCNVGNTPIRCHKGFFAFHLAAYCSSTKIKIQTKIQVRQEERYHGFLRTAKTVWKVCGTTFKCHRFVNHPLSNVVSPVSLTVLHSGFPVR